MEEYYFMWEEGMNTKPQIYYNNKHASTPQASKRKQGKSDEDNMYIGLERSRKHAHKINKITYKKAHIQKSMHT